ncbi:MAG: hypothetical protein M3R08_07870 [Bacteroidota bacterium]|nr:hypothetical protein [Bacteroidota bacterium]
MRCNYSVCLIAFPLIASDQYSGPYGQFGISEALDSGDGLSQDLQVGYTFDREHTQHDLGALAERAQESEEMYLLAGAQYGVNFKMKDTWMIGLSAEGKVGLDEAHDDPVLEEGMCLAYNINDSFSLQLGSGLQFSGADGYRTASPEINFNINYQVSP